MENNDFLDRDSIREAMKYAWSDHRHTRDQTWRTLYINFLLNLCVLLLNWNFHSFFTLTISIFLLCLLTFWSIQITIRHRNNVELTKFMHIMNCEEALGLHNDNLISGIKMPQKIIFWDAFNLNKGNTPLFILRMHLIIFILSLFFLNLRFFI